MIYYLRKPPRKRTHDLRNSYVCRGSSASRYGVQGLWPLEKLKAQVEAGAYCTNKLLCWLTAIVAVDASLDMAVYLCASGDIYVKLDGTSNVASTFVVICMYNTGVGEAT